MDERIHEPIRFNVREYKDATGENPHGYKDEWEFTFHLGSYPYTKVGDMKAKGVYHFASEMAKYKARDIMDENGMKQIEIRVVPPPDPFVLLRQTR